MNQSVVNTKIYLWIYYVLGEHYIHYYYLQTIAMKDIQIKIWHFFPDLIVPDPTSFNISTSHKPTQI